MDFDMSMDWGNLFGQSISAAGQHFANKANQRMNRENMAFQERMSSTAYQRMKQDMLAAGFNPLYWLKGAGASTPGGSMTSQSNPFEGAKNFSALANKRINAELDKFRADINKTNAEAMTTAILGDKYAAEANGSKISSALNLLNMKKLQYEMSTYKNVDEFRSSWYGSLLQKLGMSGDDIGKLFKGMKEGVDVYKGKGTSSDFKPLRSKVTDKGRTEFYYEGD